MSPRKTKRVTYVPSVDTPGDLPNAAAFESGVAFYVKSLLAFVATDGTNWTIISGADIGTVVG